MSESETFPVAGPDDCVQVVFAWPELRREFEAWLARRGLILFPIPVGSDDLPTFGVAPRHLP